MLFFFVFFFQAEDGIQDAQESRGLGDVYKRQPLRRLVGEPWPVSGKASISSGRPPSHATSSMSDRYFVDTNILMYAHDAAAGEKHARAKALVEELWESRSGVVSTQVLQELAVNLRRKAKKPLDGAATRDVVSDYLAWQVVVNGGDSILEALDLEARHQISFWDALVIQAAQVAGAEILYSEDLSDGQRYGTVRVKNPLTGDE